MDPLSIVASVITIAGITLTSLKQLRSLYGAKTEILSLINEVSDLRLVLGEVNRTIQERAKDTNLRDSSINAIAIVLKKAETNFIELIKTIDNVTRVDASRGKRKVNRFSWIYHKPKISRLQHQLTDARTTLTTLCASSTMSDMSKIQLQLTDLVSLHGENKSQGIEQQKILEVLVQQYHDPSSSSSTDLEIPGLASNTNDLSVDTPDEATDAESIATNSQETGLTSQDSILTYRGIRISATRHSPTRCDGWCGCRCHQPQTLRTPPIARLLVGSLFIGYNGVPSLSRECSERTCRRLSTPSVKIAYHFPSWFLNRMIQFAIMRSIPDGPRMPLNVPRVVPDNSEVFVCAVQGNIDGMMSLFESKLASPFDVVSIIRMPQCGKLYRYSVSAI